MSEAAAQWLAQFGPVHTVRTDKALYDYTMALKTAYLKNAAPIAKVSYDAKLQIVAHALGTHTTRSKVQGNKLKAKREIRVAAMFKEMPEVFLKMIVVHELAHLKEQDHDRAFYQLCTHMEPNYHWYERGLREYLANFS
jgi:UTP pyrophosphatase